MPPPSERLPATSSRGAAWIAVRLAILLLVFLTPSARSGGQEAVNREAELKAAFLVKFAKYVTWPEEAFADKNSPLVIGTIGKSDVAANLSEIGKKNLTVGMRALQVKFSTQPAELAGCHIVYLPPTLSKEQREAALRCVRERKVLSVGDDAAFLAEGGLLCFVVSNNRLGGHASRKNFEREGLKVSSELLNIFRPVD